MTHQNCHLSVAFMVKHHPELQDPQAMRNCNESILITSHCYKNAKKYTTQTVKPLNFSES